MVVQIKPLKGFKNYINKEINTLSLLIKSDRELRAHLSNAIEKLLAVLTCIIEHYNSNYEVYFYHKLQVLYDREPDFLKTKIYKTKLDTIEIDLNDSIENLLKIAYGKLVSHFINITILLNDEVLELSSDEFSKLNWIIRNKLAKINNEESQFVDKENEVHFIKGPINVNNKVSLFIDDNDKSQLEKPNKVPLFIDNNDPIEKALIKAREIDLQLKRNIKITNKKFINLLKISYELKMKKIEKNLNSII